MPTIQIKQEFQPSSIELHNGSLVILYDDSKNPIGVYQVTSYRGEIEGYKKTRAQYCTLIHLESGYPAFDEPSSRITTIDRLLNHIYQGIHSYTGRPAKSHHEFASMQILDKDKYTIEINY